MNGPDGWLGYGVGDTDDDTLPRNAGNWHAVSLINEKLSAKYQWARDMGVQPGPDYTETTAAAILEFCGRVGIEPVLDPNGNAVATLAMRTRLGSYPPPPPPRHACLTFSGTWAPPGVGYPSDVAQACADVVEEIPAQAPWSFGPVPPGGIGSPSYAESVSIAVEWAVGWLLDNPTRTFLIGGYSQGAEAASRVYAELLPGGRCEHLRKNFVAGYTFGNPCRPEARTFYNDPAPTVGAGIAVWRLDPGTLDWNWIDCAAAGDIYTSTPVGNNTGVIMRDAYEMAVKLQLHDFMRFAGDFGDSVWKLVQDATEDIPAALDAAGRGLGFVMTNPPTARHISYQFDEARPGQTHVALAIQHVRDWSARREPNSPATQAAA